MKRILVIFAVALLALSCARQPKLVILHCNDTHSHFDPMRGGARDGQGGIIERAAFVDSVRALYGAENVLLVHAGDFHQGTSYYSELRGSLEGKLVNALHYDCVTLGNHELDSGIEDLAARLSKIDCPVVCANCAFPEVLQKEIVPYTVVEKAGLRIGIIGFESELSKMVAAPIAQRIIQFDNVNTVNKYVPVLREQEHCDMVILLSHMGYDVDQDVIPQTRGVDLVIGGHTHTFVDDFIYVKDLDGKKVPIITDGCFGLEMGEIKVY
ncbi:MAG: metallophosphoesterase [Bacteroidales bacterium]|nr:metallophosphoesterase [Bacteroidales bacterium]